MQERKDFDPKSLSDKRIERKHCARSCHLEYPVDCCCCGDGPLAQSNSIKKGLSAENTVHLHVKEEPTKKVHMSGPH